jgi:uracil-DNA glycosylase
MDDEASIAATTIAIVLRIAFPLCFQVAPALSAVFVSSQRRRLTDVPVTGPFKRIGNQDFSSGRDCFVARRALGNSHHLTGVFQIKPTVRESAVKTALRKDLQAPVKSLRQLAEAEEGCTRCPLYRDATQAVPGEGPGRAPFMLVGEQPGDKEDLAGKPFVGPAGRLLDQALQDAGIKRNETFVTNAVKHFKHEMRGKRRLHKRPGNYEIERCKIWLDLERSLVEPDTIVALGVTAARSLTGRMPKCAASRSRWQTALA